LREDNPPHGNRTLRCSEGFVKACFTRTGVIAGGAVRNVLEAMGVKDILTKNMGTANPINVGRATMDALMKLEVSRWLQIVAAFLLKG
jgi:ribosomal protein S5